MTADKMLLEEPLAEARTLIISTSGTIFQRFNQFKNVMETAVTADDILGELNLPEATLSRLDQVDLGAKSGADLSFATIFKVRDLVIQKIGQYDSFLFATGTDTMDELAFCLSVLLDPILKRKERSFVLTGAMKPHDMEGYDGIANFGDALKVTLSSSSKLTGVLVVINEDIHLGRYVSKSDSQLLRAFKSYPGCIGNIRGGAPHFYYQPLIEPTAEDFSDLKLTQLKTRVCVWTVTINNILPDALLSQLDGIVLAAPGTGSLPEALINQLSPAWTKRLPVVVSSRCHSGNNSDEYIYRGSKEKYESKGFILSGFENLTPIQARILLIFRLSLLKDGSGDCSIM